MHSLHFYQSRNFHKFFHTDMWRFDLSIWMHIIARSSISIFIPIFLLEIGYSIPHVISFYLLLMCVDVPLNFLAAKLIQKIGAKKVYLIGTAAIVAFFTVFSQLQANQWLLISILIVLIAIYDAFYWVSHIYLFEKVVHKTKKLSENTGMLYAMKYFGALLGPAIGAGILIFSDSKSLMLFSIFIFILSAIPLFKMKMRHEKPAASEKLVRPEKFFSKKEERRNYFSVAMYGLHRTVETVIWPIFIYISFKNLASVALIPLLISFTSILFAYVAGKLAHKNREKIIALAALLISFVWIFRILSSSGIAYYSSIFLVSFFALFLSVALYSNIFARARTVGILNSATYNNASSMAAQGLVYLVLFFAVSVFNLSFTMAAVALFVITLINASFFLIKARA